MAEQESVNSSAETETVIKQNSGNTPAELTSNNQGSRISGLPQVGGGLSFNAIELPGRSTGQSVAFKTNQQWHSELQEAHCNTQQQRKEKYKYKQFLDWIKLNYPQQMNRYAHEYETDRSQFMKQFY